jgi:hypothetical protein
MTNTTVEVITSAERRRRWSAAEKERLVAAAATEHRRLASSMPSCCQPGRQLVRPRKVIHRLGKAHPHMGKPEHVGPPP